MRLNNTATCNIAAFIIIAPLTHSCLTMAAMAAVAASDISAARLKNTIIDRDIAQLTCADW
jgi:hypothetical protein